MSDSSVLCPICGSELVIRTSSKTRSRFSGCSNFPSCTYTTSDIVNHNSHVTNTQIKKLVDILSFHRSRISDIYKLLEGADTYPVTGYHLQSIIDSEAIILDEFKKCQCVLQSLVN